MLPLLKGVAAHGSSQQTESVCFLLDKAEFPIYGLAVTCHLQNI